MYTSPPCLSFIYFWEQLNNIWVETLHLPAMFEFGHGNVHTVLGRGTGVAMETPVGKQEVSEKGVWF